MAYKSEAWTLNYARQWQNDEIEPESPYRARTCNYARQRLNEAIEPTTSAMCGYACAATAERGYGDSVFCQNYAAT